MDQVKNGGKSFLLHNGSIFLHLDDTGFYIATRFISVSFQHTAIYQDIASFLPRLVNGRQVVLHGIPVNQRPHMILLIERIANFQLTVGRSQAGFKGFINAFMNDQSPRGGASRSEEHTSELQSLMRISYAVFCLKKKKQTQTNI